MNNGTVSAKYGLRITPEIFEPEPEVVQTESSKPSIWQIEREIKIALGDIENMQNILEQHKHRLENALSDILKLK